MNTTAQQSLETAEEYFDIFEARKNTLNAHYGRVEYNEGMFKKDIIKIMDERNKTAAKVNEDPVLRK